MTLKRSVAALLQVVPNVTDFETFTILSSESVMQLQIYLQIIIIAASYRRIAVKSCVLMGCRGGGLLRRWREVKAVGGTEVQVVGEIEGGVGGTEVVGGMDD